MWSADETSHLLAWLESCWLHPSRPARQKVNRTPICAANGIPTVVPGPKKISQRAAGNAKLFDVGDGACDAAIGIGAEISHIARGHLRSRYRQRANISNVIVPRVLRGSTN